MRWEEVSYEILDYESEPLQVKIFFFSTFSVEETSSIF